MVDLEDTQSQVAMVDTGVIRVARPVVAREMDATVVRWEIL